MSASEPLATFVQSVPVGAESNGAANRVYVIASENGGVWFHTTYERLKNHPGWKMHVMDCGHQVMVDRTEELAQLLLGEAV